jgi:hypothetical protein
MQSLREKRRRVKGFELFAIVLPSGLRAKTSMLPMVGEVKIWQKIPWENGD